MATPHNRIATKLALNFCVMALGIVSSGCGKTEASAPAVPMEIVMKTVHDYGRGHDSSPSLAASADQSQTQELYQARINVLLTNGDFAQLEKIGEQNRAERVRLLGDIWKTYAFFEAMGNPPHGAILKDADFESEIEAVKKWNTAYPESATARIALACAYTGYAGFARGTGYADEVSSGQWRKYAVRAGKAKQALLEAATMRDKDRGWYQAMLQVAHDESWDKMQYRDLLKQAMAFEPDYYHYYKLYANDLLPQWGGQPGEIQSFAEEVAASRPEPDSSILYFEILGALDCYCRQSEEMLASASWPKVKQGYENINRLYGTSNLKANRYAVFAYFVKDKQAAKEAFAAISSRESDIWDQNSFEAVRGWANTP